MTVLTSRASSIRSWLRNPFTRVLVPRSVRSEIAALVAVQRSVVEHLVDRPAVGTSVRLLVDNWVLRERHGAARGAVGRVVALSALDSEDTGVLVDWGNGVSVRCDLRELALAS